MSVHDKPTFLWDYDLTSDDVRHILADGSPVERRWLVERILTQARWEEIWKYLTPQQVRDYLPNLKLPPNIKATWERALELWLDDSTPQHSPLRAFDCRRAPDAALPSVMEEDMTFPSVTPENVLTPLQHRVLRRLFADYKELSAFFLTGGTALAAFYFGHRRSDDLDLFTTDAEALLTIPVVMNDLAQREGLLVERVRDFTFIQQFEVRDPQAADEVPLRMDFVKDIATQFGERRDFDGILVDDPRNIGSNKVCAILGRTDVKDFIDLYVLLQHGFDFDTLFTEAQQKDSGLTPSYFAVSLREVSSFSRLPNMIWDINLSEMQQFFLSLADKLLASLNPSG